MAARNKIVAARGHGTITVTRIFDAPRATVFAAWTSAEHLQHWFAPADHDVTFCAVDFRVGGSWRICLTSPTREVWARGVFQEIVAPERLVFTDIVLDAHDAPRFEVLTTVTFEALPKKTRLTVHARVTSVFDTAAAEGVDQRFEAGWREAVEKLAIHIAGSSDD